MRVLITGGAGFIGSSLALRLSAAHQVTVLDNLSTGIVRPELEASATIVVGDIRDAGLVQTVVDSQDAIFHFAAVVGVPNAIAHQWDCLTSSTVGTANLLNAARRRALPVLIASSSAVYGKIPASRVSEEDDIHLGNTHRLAWTYSSAKMAEELLGLAAHQELGVRVKVARLFNVIGPHQSGAYGMVVPRLVDQALGGRPLTVYGDGTHTRTFVDIEDALDALLLIWESGSWGCPYNVGGTEEVRIVDLADRIRTLCGSASSIDFRPFTEIYGQDFEETVRRVPDISRIREIGYRPQRGLAATLCRIIEWRRAL